MTTGIQFFSLFVAGMFFDKPRSSRAFQCLTIKTEKFLGFIAFSKGENYKSEPEACFYSQRILKIFKIAIIPGHITISIVFLTIKNRDSVRFIVNLLNSNCAQAVCSL